MLTAFALGLTSLDVTAALAAVGARGRDRALVVFGLVSTLGTITFGTVLSLIVGPRISEIDWVALLPRTPTENRVATFAEVFLGLALLAWGILRIQRLATRLPKPGAPRGLGSILPLSRSW